ncbi:MAG TPA: GNAT family N-acetyltransferase [Chloroflexota bacterium]|nr:GNAT family N-acetyltransferase [Chloroflexota bacterium]
MTSLQLTRFTRVEDFFPAAEPFLAAHEAENNLLLGICGTLLKRPAASAEPLYFALVRSGDETVAAALRTPPHNVVLSHIPGEAVATDAIARLAGDLRAAYGTLPGVLGPTALSRAFAEEWTRLVGGRYAIGMRQRIYRLDTVQPPVGISGRLRRAAADDHALLARWLTAFHDEADPDAPLDAEAMVAQNLDSPVRALYLWEDPDPVCLVGFGGPTPNGARVGPVYTPPEYRRRGYASAATAALSKLLLDVGRRFCFLFTDLANPTSNRIYQAIGYRPVSDVDVYRFI